MRDLALLGYVPAMAAVAWCAPERWWPGLCSGLVALSRGFRGRRRARDTDHIAHILAGRAPAARAEAIVAGLAANHHLARLQILRSHRPDSWHPPIRLVGQGHVEAALREGRGAILWVAPFVFCNLVTKITLRQAGFGVTHLSRPEHGVSIGRLGSRLFNPIWTAAESRHLDERLVLSADRPAEALRVLIERVRANRLISIHVGTEGQRQQAVPFLNGRLTVADGAPGLARRTGAALLPVCTVRTAAGQFETIVEAPLRVDPDVDARPAVRELVAQCAAIMESWALRWPDQFRGWSLVTAAPPGSAEESPPP